MHIEGQISSDDKKDDCQRLLRGDPFLKVPHPTLAYKDLYDLSAL